MPTPQSAAAWHANRETALMRLVSTLNKSDVPYCLVGDTRGLPKEIPGDVDVVVDQASLPGMAGLLSRFCAEEGISLVQVLQHELTAYGFALAWRDERGSWLFLMSDVCGNYYHLGRFFLKADELLATRTPAVDEAGVAKGFYITSPACEFIYYLLKKVDKQDFNLRHGDHLSEQWRKDPAGALRQLRRFWPEIEMNFLAHAAENNSWAEVIAALAKVQKSLHRHHPFSLKVSMREWLRKIRRVRQPTGVLVAVLGPDGSGKSSLIERMVIALAPAFRRTRRFHLRPNLGRQSGDGAPVVDPHGQAPRSWFSSTLKLFYWLFDYTAGYVLKVRPQLVRSTLVVFDRYYHDLLVDPRRYRFRGPLWLARLLGKFVPQPDLWILLDAPAETLQKRKREVSVAESIRQRKAYRQQIGLFPNHVVVDASQPLEKVVTDVNQAILDFMAQRIKKRYRSQ